MNKSILLLFLICLLSWQIEAQVYLDQFDNGTTDNVEVPTGFTSEEADDEWTITRDNSAGIEWNAVSYKPHDQETGTPITIDTVSYTHLTLPTTPYV